MNGFFSIQYKDNEETTKLGIFLPKILGELKNYQIVWDLNKINTLNCRYRWELGSNIDSILLEFLEASNKEDIFLINFRNKGEFKHIFEKFIDVIETRLQYLYCYKTDGMWEDGISYIDYFYNSHGVNGNIISNVILEVYKELK